MRKHYPLNAAGVEDAGLLPWTDGVPATGVEGSYPGQALVTDTEAEALNAIAAAGLPTSGADLTQLAQAISRGIYVGGFTGSANALSASLPNAVAFPSLLPGMRFQGIALATNTGAVTLTLAGFVTPPGTLNLLRRDGNTLKPGDIQVGSPFSFGYDGAAYRMAVPTPSEMAPTGTSVWHYGTDTSTTAAVLVADIAPSISAHASGLAYSIKTANAAVSGGTTAVLGGLPSRPVARADGTPIRSGDWGIGEIIVLLDDGSRLRLQGVKSSFVPARNLESYVVAGSYTFTVPDGVYWIFCEAVGGGGGGGGGQGGVQWSSGGGGSGGYASGWIAVTPGQQIPLIVGAKGAGATNASGARGQTGGTTSVGTFMQATGGGGGTGSPGTSGGGDPGIGSGGQKNLYGATGGDGNNINPNVQGGAGGASAFGGGGRTSTLDNTSTRGIASGSGGGGIWGSFTTAQNGGAGADGAIFIQY